MSAAQKEAAASTAAKKTGAAKKDGAAKKEAAPKAPKDAANGVTRPKSGTQTGQIWEIADRLSNKGKKAIVRADVLKEAEAKGINASTAATQYGRWRRYNGLGKEQAAATEGAAQ